MKSLIICFGAILLMVCMPLFNDSVHDARTDEYSQSFAGEETGSGVYSGNVTLSEDLFNDHVGNVEEITSNVSSDSPTATSYNSANNLLVYGGVVGSENRTMWYEYISHNSLLVLCLCNYRHGWWSHLCVL